ncbi:MAG: serine-type D-Ala-D-Ala carboxypeptidase [Legionellales bacterium RIFCSPHIGHO2_12_FULL_35_11]|nr:MAG: serine-type D-Ala-D-Ala carboxypeptidase [Legionellales bacterium RIFCSPHIGHO2_12_FULL_35_11]
MKKFFRSPAKILVFISLAFSSSIFYADTPSNIPQPTAPSAPPQIIPSPPNVNSKSYILIDANSGKVIAEKNSEERLPPASLTKVMTLYVVSNALNNKQIHLNDNVRISETAWKIGGSRMFVKEGQMVAIKDLLKGVIVDSGNDACVALAEHLGGSEEGFTELMNSQAKSLGLNNTHFTDSTGLPSNDLYTTAKDLSVLARALINNFPQYYHWYKEKWFTFNEIRQPNRNRLLWRDGQVDGIKTGFTNDAGYCLISSAKRGDMRLIAVVLHAPTESTRADDSEKLLNYGFRFYETHQLYKANQAISKVKIYKGDNDSIDVGVLKDNFITIPSGQYSRLVISTKIPNFIEAPIEKGQQIGELVVKFDDNVIETQSLYALSDEKAGGMYTRAVGSIKIMFARWFG